MQHKWIVVFTALVLFSLVLAPVGTAQAQADTQEVGPDCPPYEPGMPKDSDFLHSLPPECMGTYKELTRQASPAATARDAQPMAAGGPDGFGYTYDDSVPYNWISATTNSGLTGYGEFTGPIDIGFSFPFYGISQSQLYFNTHGLITFGAGSQEAGRGIFPSETSPNNLIATFWDWLLVGSPFNSGAIYYLRGGNAPNRYFVVEWRDVELDYGSSTVPFSFEAILHENGDILFQYQSLPEPYFSTVVGIEDSIGYDGLRYEWNLTALKAIRFSYPTISMARLLISPAVQAGAFAPIDGYQEFPITVTNPGTAGADTYDVAPSSAWPFTVYRADGVTPLTDTDGDSLIDTGSLPQGHSITLIARVTTPNGAQTGDENKATVTITSSLNPSQARAINLFTSIPAKFANVFQDEANGAMSFVTLDSSGESISKATADNHFGYEIAVSKMPNNNYFYVWNMGYHNGDRWVDDIEYAILGPSGNLILPATKLTNNNGAALYTSDQLPAAAVAPDGTIGIVWRRYLSDSSTDTYNYNVYFATLNSSGSLLTGPTNITNKPFVDGDAPRFESLTIAASDDNRFVIGWNESLYVGLGAYERDVWYAIRNTAGESVFAPRAFTTDHSNYGPILNSLTGGKVIMTWSRGSQYSYKLEYTIINSNGTRVGLPYFNFDYHSITTPDAVQLPNGKIAIAWPTHTGVQFVILNSSFLPEGGFSADTPNVTDGDRLSVTTDTSSRVIMTWSAGGAGNTLFYALGDSNGTFLTGPMPYKISGNYIESSSNGQGSARYEPGIAATFGDVQPSYWASSYIERLYAAGITGGCGVNPPQYCPEGTVTRAQMAIFLLRGIHGSSYAPPAVGNSTGFGDVQPNHWAGAWIKQLVTEGITAGCGSGNYCPESPVTRAQMAIFLLRSKYGASYSPPAVGSSTGFADVDTTHWAGAWIKQLVAEGITAGCGNGNYCPENPVTRAQMAVFLVRTFNLP